MKTFGLPGQFDTQSGTMRGSVLDYAVRTTPFAQVDSLHATPHNGVDFAPLDNPNAPIKCPLDGIVSYNNVQIWPGPGEKVLFDFVDSSGNRVRKALQPGEPDRGGYTIIILHPGPWRLPDGRAALSAATLYCHLREQPALPVGTTVRAGDVIGNVGTTGYSTGEHLHWNLAFLFDGTTGFFPPDMSNIDNIVDPTPYIGIPVVDVPDPRSIPTVAQLSEIGLEVLIGANPNARITPAKAGDVVPQPNDGWDSWIIEARR